MSHAAPYPPFVMPERSLDVTVGSPTDAHGAIGHVVFQGDGPPRYAGLSSARAAELGFRGEKGQTLSLNGTDGPVLVLVGGGKKDEATATLVRDAAAHFARAVPAHSSLAFVLPQTADGCEAAAAAAVEGAVLSRYQFRIGKQGKEPQLNALMIACDSERREKAQAGVDRGLVIVRATHLARDLSGTPGGILTATRLGELAVDLAAEHGLEVEVSGEDDLVALGCGGLLGINLGSVEPPAMIKLVYRPEGEPTGRLTLVGKGITYDAGGLALKPGDEVHATMKNDMTGAGAILAAMTALRELGCTTQVTGYLMCTDNMPSGSALRLGDIVVVRGGTTVEVVNTDAEGRMVMSDALVLAQEEPVDAIIDIATLTGAAIRTLGPEIAAVLGNSRDVLNQIEASAVRVDEPVWELPLARRYRRQLDSVVADLRNLGGPDAGTITAALFLEEFIKGVPWGHIDIAGPAQNAAPDRWRNQGTTGFGTRMLIDIALNFTVPAPLEVTPA